LVLITEIPHFIILPSASQTKYKKYLQNLYCEYYSTKNKKILQIEKSCNKMSLLPTLVQLFQIT